MADNLGRKPIAGVAEASERRHPTRLPILVCRRKPVPQVDGATTIVAAGFCSHSLKVTLLPK
jgi:hypothetical protein